MIRYERAPDIKRRMEEIASVLGLSHIDFSRLGCVRSFGSRSRYVLARCHGLSKVFQHALGIDARYVIEIVSENFGKLSEEEKTKTLIHELLHIPKSFGGGFRHHKNHVNRRTVERAYRRYVEGKLL